ncbi:MAG: acetate/propionate family kinase [Deltaproteobacteria bacterium]|nr:acetate/propionate family kinase [Deltaproteobacteria bacterium]
MRDAILVLNAGSSSLKFTQFALAGPGRLEVALHGAFEELEGAARFRARDAHGVSIGTHAWPAGEAPGHDGALDYLFDWLPARAADLRVVAVGHRVVHGGGAFTAPVRVDAAVLDQLTALIPLAPLHQPHNLRPMRTLAARRPELPQVACFDTAFHAGAPALAQAFALPPALTERGVRRYGFHGLSYEYIARVLPTYDTRAAAGRTVVMHLGNGASLCALQGGRSVATTMGFTAIDGVPMGTRSGALDPGVLLYCLRELGMDAAALESLLYRESGLLGVSGVSSDMRELLASAAPRARFAVDLFVYRIGREIGSLAAALGGLDALVFTAGIGEHAAEVRARICQDASWLGVALDAAANSSGGPRISSAASRVAAWVIPTDEELMIARHVERLLGC